MLLRAVVTAAREKSDKKRRIQMQPPAGSQGLQEISDMHSKGEQPARISARTTPSMALRCRSSSSREVCKWLVSAEMVTAAQPLVGMVWLMVSIFAPHWAKMVSREDKLPVSSWRVS